MIFMHGKIEKKLGKETLYSTSIHAGVIIGKQSVGVGIQPISNILQFTLTGYIFNQKTPTMFALLIATILRPILIGVGQTDRSRSNRSESVYLLILYISTYC